MKNFQEYKVIAIIGIIVVALFLLSIDFQDKGTVTAKSNDSAQATQVNENEYPLAPLFTLNDVDGNKISLADYKGKIVFVNFWATWCGPCRTEIPDFVKLIEKYGDDGFQILGITVDNPKDYKKIPGFMEQFKMNYPVLLDQAGEVNYMYGGIQSIPTTFVLNREGKALGRILGARSYEEFERILKQIL